MKYKITWPLIHNEQTLSSHQHNCVETSEKPDMITATLLTLSLETALISDLFGAWSTTFF